MLGKSNYNYICDVCGDEAATVTLDLVESYISNVIDDEATSALYGSFLSDTEDTINSVTYNDIKVAFCKAVYSELEIGTYDIKQLYTSSQMLKVVVALGLEHFDQLV